MLDCNQHDTFISETQTLVPPPRVNQEIGGKMGDSSDRVTGGGAMKNSLISP